MAMRAGHFPAVLALLLAACAAEKAPPLSAPRPASPPPVISGPSKSSPQSYFPLASGNIWGFRCRLGEEEGFEKKLELRGSETINGLTYYRAAIALPAGEQTFYLFRSSEGLIFKTLEPSSGERQLFGAEELRQGLKLADDKSARREIRRTPATGEIETLVVENFWPDDPNLPETQRLEEWQGTYFARGIGPVAEADGAGSSCELIAYSVK